ncbi:hypothetical protein RvVAT039_pl06700 (plasmid) [Agrobacterium vitis]|nr:hypothetical protein RvVAT039_pl06700 [Agrobacterium vitis]
MKQSRHAVVRWDNGLVGIGDGTRIDRPSIVAHAPKPPQAKIGSFLTLNQVRVFAYPISPHKVAFNLTIQFP